MRLFILFILFTSSVGAAGYGWEDMSHDTQIQIEVVHAIALEESRKSVGDGLMMPWPWTLQHAGKAYYMPTQAAAVQKLRELLAAGYKNIDVGPLQVNLRWNGGLVDRPEHLLDPNINLWAAAQVLNNCGRSSGWGLASRIACYHGGPKKPPRALRYARRVLKRAIYLESLGK